VAKAIGPIEVQWETYNFKCMHTQAIYVVPRVVDSIVAQLAQYKLKSPYTYIISDVPRVAHRRKVP